MLPTGMNMMPQDAVSQQDLLDWVMAGAGGFMDSNGGPPIMPPGAMIPPGVVGGPIPPGAIPMHPHMHPNNAAMHPGYNNILTCVVIMLYSYVIVFKYISL